jgi:hypothetical protein
LGGDPGRDDVGVCMCALEDARQELRHSGSVLRDAEEG